LFIKDQAIWSFLRIAFSFFKYPKLL